MSAKSPKKVKGKSSAKPAATEPKFASVGTKTDDIDVLLSYRIVELFSEGLYASPNEAVEELVANSFDAGATRVGVLLSAKTCRYAER